MINITNLHDCYIITTNETKSFFLRNNQISLTSNIKFLTYDYVIKNLHYTYDKKAITFLIQHHNELDYYSSKMFLKASTLLSNKIHLKKAEKLFCYRNELLEKNLLYFDDFFIPLLKKTPIFIDSDVAVESLMNLLNSFGISYEILENRHQNLDKNHILNFSNAFEEVYYVLNSISDLIFKGENPDNILIYGVSDLYYPYFKNLSPLFGFDIDMPNGMPYMNFQIIKVFLNSIKNKTLNEAYNEFIETKPSDYDLDILNNAMTILIKYQADELSEAKKLSLYKSILLEHRYVINRLQNCPHVISELIYGTNAKIFAMNFSQGVFPKIFRDNDFFDTNELRKLNSFTCDEKNFIEKNIIKELLSSPNLISISHKEFGLDGNNYESGLIKEFSLKSVFPKIALKQFSETALSLYASSTFDYLRKYRYIHPDYYLIKQEVNIPYMTFSNKYIPFEIKQQNIKMSYSRANTFYECHYHYYLQYLLFSYKGTDNFTAIVGTLIHRCLELMYSKSFDINKEFSEFIVLNNLDASQIMFLNRIKDDTNKLISFIKKQESSYHIEPKIETEVSKTHNITNNISIDGRIDKLISFDINGIKHFAIVDFKSSMKPFYFKYLNYGLSLQLPTYLAMIKLDNKNNKIIGAFYEKILVDKKEQLSLDNDNYLKNFYLEGIMNDNIEYLKLIDPFLDGEYVKSLKISKKTGKFDSRLYSSKKLIKEEELDSIADIAINKIKEAGELIIKNKFDLTPINVDDKIISCKYCPFNDVCFVNVYDIKTIKTDVLSEGEEDGE